MSQTLTGKYVADEFAGAVSARVARGLLFVGTAPHGLVYSTPDGFAWNEFWETGECVVTAIGYYADALFVGTGPEGKILMHNFSTGNRFHYVTTGDYEVAALVEHDNRLYALTSPSGMVLSFDGDVWRKEYEAFMAGTSLASDGTTLYATFSDSFSVLVLDASGAWKFASDADGPLSMASVGTVTTSLEALAKNDGFDYGADHAVLFGGKFYFAGFKRPTLYSFDGSALSVAHQFAGGAITGVEVADNQIFVSVGDLVYEYTEPRVLEEAGETSSESSDQEEISG